MPNENTTSDEASPLLAGSSHPNGLIAQGNMTTLLPDDVLRHIGSFLDVKDLHNVRVDRRLRRIFSEKILHATLLKWVVYGQPEKAAEIWAQHPDYLLKKGIVETPSGRRYENASPLLVALFEGDTDMWHRMLGVTIDAAGNITGRNYPAGISENQVLKVFLEYEARKAIDAYDFSPLITALQTYVDNYSSWSFESRVDHWCLVVGGAQLRAPAHVKQEYCHPTRAFHPVPSFHGCLPRSTKLYSDVDILIPGSGLGVDFGLIRGGLPRAEGARLARLGGLLVGPAPHLRRLPFDVAAITALRDTRNSDPGKFIEFVNQLGLINQTRMTA